MNIPSNLKELNWENLEEESQETIEKCYVRSLEEVFYKVNEEMPGQKAMISMMMRTVVLKDLSTMQFVFWDFKSGREIGRVDRNLISPQEIAKT